MELEESVVKLNFRSVRGNGLALPGTSYHFFFS